MKHLNLLRVCLALPFAFISFTGTAQNGNANPNAQGNGQWKTDGNLADPGHFIGTVNDRPVIFKSNNAERFRLTPEGNVGIGTSTPATTLDVNGNTTLRNDVFMPGIPLASAGDQLVFIDASGQLKKGDGNSLGDYLYEDKLCPEGDIVSPKWANGTNKIFVKCPQVRVGISTSNPLYTFDVRGEAYFSKNVGVGAEPIYNVQLLTKSTQGVGLCIDQNAAGLYSYALKINTNDEATKAIGVYSNVYNKEILTFMSNGQLVISNANQKILQLETNGLLRGRQIKLDLDNWADYVFDENYPLMPLSEVEAFVKENHHLPNIPSESELIEEGLDLEEMNRMLMEKVEELTLYLIEQEKKIETLQKKVGHLESGK